MTYASYTRFLWQAVEKPFLRRGYKARTGEESSLCLINEHFSPFLSPLR